MQQELLAKFKELGATYENANNRMYALDFEPGVDVQPILAYLETLKSEDLLDYRINEN
jgi:hypothetical protein